MEYKIEETKLPAAAFANRVRGKSKYPYAGMKAGQNFYASVSSKTLINSYYKWFKKNFPGAEHKGRCSVKREGEGARFYLLADHPDQKPELVKSA